MKKAQLDLVAAQEDVARLGEEIAEAKAQYKDGADVRNRME